MRYRRLHGLGLTALMLIGLASLASLAAEPAADSDQQIKLANGQCLSCHSEAGLKADPHADIHLEGLANHLISPERFAKSVHGEEGCKDCHGEPYAQFPHQANARAQIKMCPECHKSSKREKLPEFQSTLHFKNHPHNFNCVSCHNPHTLENAKALGSDKKLVAQDNGMCLDCHNSDQRFGQFSPEPRPDLAALHSWLPNAALHWQSARCIDCHTPAKENGGTSHVILGKDKATRDCSTCHNATSSLRTRLYRHFADQGIEKAGFINGAILQGAYVVGATRNLWLDQAVWAATLLLVIGLIGHGLVRFITGRLRRRRK